MSRTKEQLIAAIREARDAFRTAIYGEDVRGAMVEIADVVAEAVGDQLIEVDTGLTQRGAGADAKTVGDEAFLYRGSAASGTAVHSLVQAGAYNLTANGGYTDLPDGYPAAAGARLLVFRGLALSGSATFGITQVIITAAKPAQVWVSSYAGGIWVAWTELARSADLDGAVQTLSAALSAVEASVDTQAQRAADRSAALAEAVLTLPRPAGTDSGLYTFEVGGIYTSGDYAGVNMPSSAELYPYRCRTRGWAAGPAGAGDMRLVLDSDVYQFAVLRYKGEPSHANYIDSTGWVRHSEVVGKKAYADGESYDVTALRVVAARVDGEAMTAEDVDAVREAFAIYVGGTDATLSVSGMAADAEAVGRRFDELETALQDEPVTLSCPIAGTGYVRVSDGGITASSLSSHTDYIDVSRYGTLTYRRQGSTSRTPAGGLCFYDTDKVYLSGVRAAGSQPDYGYVDEPYTVSVPRGAVWARFTVFTDTETYGAFSATATGKIFGELVEAVSASVGSSSAEQILLGLHEVPKNRGVLNAIKRARQLADVRWSPAAELPRAGSMAHRTNYSAPASQNIFLEGEGYQGIPYSDDHIVGCNGAAVSTFITAASNARSVECVNTREAGAAKSWYGSVCVTLVCHALRLPQVKSTAFDKLAGEGAPFADLGYLDGDGQHIALEALELCDVLWEDSHVAIVTDLLRDPSGAVIGVELSEATSAGLPSNDRLGCPFGGIARRMVWTPEAFYARWGGSVRSDDGYKVFRLDADLLAAVDYIADPAVPMGDEGRQDFSPWLPLMPYYGDRCSFHISDGQTKTLPLLVNASGFTHVHVLKNGSDYGGDSGRYEIQTDATYGLSASISFTGVASRGEYEAYLCTVEGGVEKNASSSCRWYVYRSPVRSITVDGQLARFEQTWDKGFVIPTGVCFGGSLIDGDNVAVVPRDAVTVSEVSGGYKVSWVCAIPDGVASWETTSYEYTAGIYGGIQLNNQTGGGAVD